MKPAFSFIFVVLALNAACSESVDRTAKKRIFSAEDPPKVISEASEKIQADALGTQADATRRVLRMGAAETTERLGPHKYNATSSFEWTMPGRAVKLVEHRTLFAGPGGVSGDFHGTIDNSRDQGMEVIRVQGQVFARSRYGKFRQRQRDRGMAEKQREEVFGALRDFDTLFFGRLKLEPQGAVAHEGRTALKYAVGLSSESPAESAAIALPPVGHPKNDDPTTQRRLGFFENRQPRSVEGEVWVDEKTGVVLKAKVSGRLAVPAGKEGGDALAKLSLEATLSEIGRTEPLSAPAEFLPDQDKPSGIADVLDRFGIPRGGKPDAGVKVPAAEPEDDDG